MHHCFDRFIHPYIANDTFRLIQVVQHLAIFISHACLGMRVETKQKNKRWNPCNVYILVLFRGKLFSMTLRSCSATGQKERSGSVKSQLNGLPLLLLLLLPPPRSSCICCQHCCVWMFAVGACQRIESRWHYGHRGFAGWPYRRRFVMHGIVLGCNYEVCPEVCSLASAITAAPMPQ